MIRLFVVCLLAVIPAAAQDYWHRAAGSLGALMPQSGVQADRFKNAATLSFDYGFRFHRHGQFDGGIDTAFGKERGTDTRRNIYIPRVGYRVIVPVWQDRVETHLGFGGAHSLLKPSIDGYQSWLVYGQIGANYAIDVDRKYRAGFTLRWLRDPIGRPVQQWIGFAGEISYNWGKGL